MAEERTITLNDFLKEEEIARAAKIYREVRDNRKAGDPSFAQRCADEIITPVLPRINAALGQENDAMYLAFVCEFVIAQIVR